MHLLSARYPGQADFVGDSGAPPRILSTDDQSHVGDELDLLPLANCIAELA
jgi:hypothetical protein